MVLTNRPHATSLGACLTLPFHKAYFTADVEFAEATVQNAVFMEVDFAAVRRLDPAVTVLWKIFDNPAMRRCLVVFDLALGPAQPVFQLTAGSIEGIANGDINIFVSMIQPAVAADHYLAARYRDVDPDLIETSMMVVLAYRLHYDPARHNMIMKAIEFPCFFANPGLNSRRWFHILKGDL